MTDLLRAPNPATLQYAEGGRQLRDFLSRHPLPETRGSLLDHLRGGLTSKTPLAAGPPPADLDAHLSLLDALTRAGDAAGGENTLALFGERMPRVLTVEALNAALRPLSRVDDRLIRALEIHRLLGETPGRLQVRQYIDFIFETERLVATLGKDPEPTAHKLKRIARLHDALQTSHLSSAAYAKYAKPLQALQADLLRDPASVENRESSVPAEVPKKTQQSRPDEQRAAPRARTHPDDHVTMNNVRFALRNWSPRGLLFGPVGNPPSLGEKVELKVVAMLKADRVRFGAVGEVVRVANGEVAVRYECTSPGAAPQIKAYFDSFQ